MNEVQSLVEFFASAPKPWVGDISGVGVAGEPRLASNPPVMDRRAIETVSARPQGRLQVLPDNRRDLNALAPEGGATGVAI
jgi:hypothetical protein